MTDDVIDPYVPVLTPMDRKTIVNAIRKRLPEVRKITMVDLDKERHLYQLVLLCELKHETAIIIEDHFDMMMRHKDLMNLVDKFAEEIKARKLKRKTNMLPKNFLRENSDDLLRKFQ